MALRVMLSRLPIQCSRERDALAKIVAVMDPRNLQSPGGLSPGGADLELEENPFDVEFSKDSVNDALDFSSLSQDSAKNGFAVLNSSLPEQLLEHHLTSYASAKHNGAATREKKVEMAFGIRSWSPPMEVMLEIYWTLKALRMERKEKKNLSGLGVELGSNETALWTGMVYLIETRARVQDLVNLQLHMVDSIIRSVEPGAGKFNMAVPDPNFCDNTSDSGRFIKEKMDHSSRYGGRMQTHS